MKICLRLVRRSIQLLFTPLKKFIQEWEKDNFGHRLLKVLIDVFVVLHLIGMLAPHLKII